MSIKIVCISDTHNYHKSVNLPAGDILIHAGDSTGRGYEHEIREFGAWLRTLKQFQYVVVISGNHDFGFEDSPKESRNWLLGEGWMERMIDSSRLPDVPQIRYLQDDQLWLNVNGQDLKIYGSPWQPWFHNWAFNLYSEDLKEKWDLIPNDTDILVTHGPPYRLCDETASGEFVGCRELRAALQRVKPKLHVCGHIHEARGIARFGDTLVANAAICTLKYNPTQEPLVFEYDNGQVRQAPKVQGQEKAKDGMSEVSESLSDED